MTHEEIKNIVYRNLQGGEPNFNYTKASVTCKDYSDVNTSKDVVNHPDHYQSKSSVQIECIDAMRAAFGDEAVAYFCLCNAMKYIYRCETKGGNNDIRKANWYLNKYLELKEK